MNRLCPMCGVRTDEARCPDDSTATLVLAQNPDSRLTEGTEINGRYRIGPLIGRGGFGAVYRATSLTTGQAMAVKVLGVSLDSDESELIQRFFAEAQITAGLKHPNTIRVFDFGQTEGGALYIAMELLSGQALNELLRERRKQDSALTQEETLNVATQTLRSLTEAHMNGLVHRDLKPHNIFLNDVPGDDPVVKVLDFGIAKRLGSNLTGTGQAFGTPTYMSPEQAQNRPIDARSDLYSLGVVLYQCIAGACPFEGDNPLAVLLSHVTDKPVDLHDRAAHPVSREFTDLIMRSLAKAPDDRFAGAVEMRKALEACEPAPSLGSWQQRTAAPSDDDDDSGVGTDDQTVAYTPVTDGAASSALDKAGSTGTTDNEEESLGGSGFTQAFMNRGVAEDLRVAPGSAELADPIYPDDTPEKQPSNAGKWGFLILFLAVAVGVGAWLALGNGGSLTSDAEHAASPVVVPPAVNEPKATAAESSQVDGGTKAGGDAAVAPSAGHPSAVAPSAGHPNPSAGHPNPSAGHPNPSAGHPGKAAPATTAAAATAPDTITEPPAPINVVLKTAPAGATVHDHGKLLGKTPLSVLIPDHGPMRLTLSRHGYRDKEVMIIASDAPSRTVKLSKLTPKARPRVKRRPRPTAVKPSRPKVKSALEERL